MSSLARLNPLKADIDRASDVAATLPTRGGPVPVRIHGGEKYHEIVIIGRSRSLPHVHNPLGYPAWVGEDDCSGGRTNIGAIVGPNSKTQRLPIVDSIHLPK